MWICDLCLEVNDDDHTKCIKCGEDKAPQVKLADEIRSVQQSSAFGVTPVAQAYLPTTSLIIPSSTTVSPKLVRGGLITLAAGWVILLIVLAFSVVNPPVPASNPGATASSIAASTTFVRDRQILRIFLVIVLPLAVLFVPSTHWEFNPKSGLLIRSRGNMISRSEDGVWDLQSIEKAHVGEISAINASGGKGITSDPDGFNILLTIQLVFKNNETLNIGPEVRSDTWPQQKADEINRFLHKWQRQL
jgi:hypothetical protein